MRRKFLLSVTILALMSAGAIAVAPAGAQATPIPPRGCVEATHGEVTGWSTSAAPLASVESAPGVPPLATEAAVAALVQAQPLLESAVGSPGEARPLSICLVRDSRAIAAIHLDSSGPETSGAALAGLGVALVAGDRVSDVQRLTVHEMAHLLIAERSRRKGERPIPEWLNEGAADYLAALATNSAGQIEDASRALAAGGDLPQMRWLNANDPSRLGAREVDTYYLASTSLVTTLVSEHGWGTVWEMLRITGKLPAALEREWHRHLEIEDALPKSIAGRNALTGELNGRGSTAGA